MIPRDLGYPVSLVVRGGYGCKRVKWVARIEVEYYSLYLCPDNLHSIQSINLVSASSFW
ncbi:molybdopterin-dependent oxidoreductase [Chloroflexota bacterium]